MKSLLILICLASCMWSYSQSTHKFVKSGNSFTYQVGNGAVTTYTTAVSIDVQPDTAQIRIYVNYTTKTFIIMLRTDIIQVGGVTVTGSIYNKRTAIAAVLPTGDYSCVTCVPTIYTNIDGSQGIAAYATQAQVAAKLNVSDTGTFLPPLRNAIPSTASISGKLNISDTVGFAKRPNIRDSVLNRTVQVQTITAMRNLPVLNNMQVQTAGRLSQFDNQGGFYIWSDTSTAVEDAVLYNVIKSNSSGTGAWIRIFQRAKSYLPDGAVLELNGLNKRLYLNGTTDANGEITVNLTEERTANGTPIFSTIRFIDTWVPTGSSTISNAIQSYMKVAPTTSGLKTVTYGFYKANALTITLGLLYTPFASIGAGTVVAFRIDGM